MTTTQATGMTEDQMVHVVRNALLVAGQEMGADGDHMPLVKATIHDIMQDWQQVQVNRAVDAELKTHLYAQLDIMEKEVPHCAPEAQADITAKLKEIRGIYDAYFAPVSTPVTFTNEAEIPPHIRRAEAILATLEVDDE